MAARRSQVAHRAQVAARSRTAKRRAPKAVEALEALYARLPDVACRGLCADSCRSPIDMSDLERDRIRTTSGVHIPERARWPATAPCPALTAENRCATHATRPTICRLWGTGTAETMACPHGCVIDGDRLTDEQLIDVTLTSFEIGGHPEFAHLTDQMRILAADPRIQPVLARLIRGDATPQMLLAALQHHRLGRLLAQANTDDHEGP
ncbi:hypothetical protein PS9374_04453 [Planomonospora sphaerica]|uniref:Fe-S oxidoreductase n=1 Tax=Planomonospora sphaerica TaxID=161355 RepID=A0A171DIS9_9ACTN|nr:YkgJ family cysteine cluster protein [Planomonospora sphaerica]GAT68788.1 hypothetical protein PS9374_04453 [Planomonospora sphaerica]